MKKLHILLLALTIPFVLLAQPTFNPNCDGERYLEEVFPDEPIMTTEKFGENITIDGENVELFMDIFQPAGDMAENRPVILYSFGGSYIGGNRGNTHDICIQMAKKGFVTAAIDYRLYDRTLPPFGPFPDSLSMMEVVIKAVGDTKAAVRHLRKDAATDNEYRIDPNWIFAGGYSSGSINSLHAAVLQEDEVPEFLQTIYTDNGGFEGNTDLPGDSNMDYSSSIQGVINYYGGLNRGIWIDENDVPFISLHGDEDGTVPYGHGDARILIFPIVSIDGSAVLHPIAEDLGIKNELITVPGGGHGTFDVMWFDSMEVRSTRFLTEIICGELTSIDEPTQSISTNVYPNPSSDQIKVVLKGNQSNYKTLITNQLGQVVYQSNDSNLYGFNLQKSEIGTGIFFLNIVFEDKNIQPVYHKIVFN